jgi:hypothetical protein
MNVNGSFKSISITSWDGLWKDNLKLSWPFLASWQQSKEDNEYHSTLTALTLI